jgi:hypothetical protein
MGAGLFEREHLALMAKEGDPLFPDVDGKAASVGNLVDRGDSVTHEE